MGGKDNRLEKQMQVTSGKSWITLWLLGGVLAGVIAWSILDTLPERIEGPGIVQLDGGIQSISAEGEGRIEEVLVRPDQQVAQGQVIVRMRDVVRDAQTEAAQRQYEQAERLHADTLSQQNLQIQRLQQDRTRMQRELLDLQGRVVEIEKGILDQIFTRPQLDAAQRAVAQKQTEIVLVNDQLGRAGNVVVQSQTALELARNRRDSAVRLSESVSEVRARIAGKVLAVHKQRSDTVRPGEPIADVETGSTIKITAYIAASNGKRVVSGQRVRLTVKGFLPEQFGYLLGTVEFVQEIPVPARQADTVVGREVVTSPSYVVTIRPIPDPKTRSGFSWTDGQGPSEQVATNTPVVAAVQVSERAPYTYVLPIDKKHRVPEAQRSVDATTPGKPGS